MSNDHALCCDCDECLNRNGGQRLASDPVVHIRPPIQKVARDNYLKTRRESYARTRKRRATCTGRPPVLT